MTHKERMKIIEGKKEKLLNHTIVSVAYDLFSEMMELTLDNGWCIFVEIHKEDDK